MKRQLIDYLRKQIRKIKHYLRKKKSKKIWVDKWGIKWLIDLSNSLDCALINNHSRNSEYPHYISALATRASNVLAIDVGANKGYFAIPLSKYFKKVICYEPVSLIYKQLEENVSLNSFLNIKCQQVAISNFIGEGTIFVQESLDDESNLNTGLSSIDERPIYVVGQEDIQIRTLDSEVKEVDFIKIDCEGHEYKVLQGAANLIKKNLPDILWEASITISKENVKRCFIYLNELGYIQYKVSENSIPTVIFDLEEFLIAESNIDVFATINLLEINNE